MFPIRKRKTTYGTFESKRARYDNTIDMAFMKRRMNYRRRSTYKRRTPYNRRSNNGAFFSPKGSQPSIKRKHWEWLKIRVALSNQSTAQDITASALFTAAQDQLEYQPSAIKVSSAQFWNSAGVTAGTQKPFITAEPYTLTALPTSEDIIIGKTEDEGNLNIPAKIGYKWSNTDAQITFPFGSTKKIIKVTANNGDNCYAHIMIQHFKEG